MDIIGPFSPPSSEGHCYILATIDYFSKWAEAIMLRYIKHANIVQFIQVHIIYRFGILENILADNGQPFTSSPVAKLLSKYNIEPNHSTRYYPQANGLAEAFNKTRCKILKNTVSKNKRDWHERLPEALWAYRISFRTLTLATSYSLVFRTKVVLPIEVQIHSLHVTIQENLTDEESAKVCMSELEILDESRFQAQQSLEIYQARMANANNKQVKLISFKKGVLVLMVHHYLTYQRKVRTQMGRSLCLEKVNSNRAYLLTTMDGERILPPTNIRFLKRYYP